MPNSTDPKTTPPVSAPTAAPMNPGDEAPAGSPGTGENVCPVCNGTGQVRGQPCADCGGSGRVVTGIGGA